MTLQSQRWQRSNLQPLQIEICPFHCGEHFGRQLPGHGDQEIATQQLLIAGTTQRQITADKIEIGLNQWDGQLQAHGGIKHLLSGLINRQIGWKLHHPHQGRIRGQQHRHLIGIELILLAQLTNQSRHLGRIGGDTTLECFSRKINPSDARKIESAIAQVAQCIPQQTVVELQHQLPLGHFAPQ